MWHGFRLLAGECYSPLFLTQMLVKITSREFHRLCAKDYAMSVRQKLFFKVPWWQQKQVDEYRQMKITFWFFDNVAKTCSYGLKISRNIEANNLFFLKYNFMYLPPFRQVPLKLAKCFGWLFCHVIAKYLISQFAVFSYSLSL